MMQKLIGKCPDCKAPVEVIVDGIKRLENVAVKYTCVQCKKCNILNGNSMGVMVK